MKLSMIDLNTTHVSVQLYIVTENIHALQQFKYNPCIGSIFSDLTKQALKEKFKYNPCIGSICKSN